MRDAEANAGIQVHFIGTSAGAPSLSRHFSSLLLRCTGYCVLMDCGDGISRALLERNIGFDEMDAILVSHLHADHFSGLPSLLTAMKAAQRKKALKIFVPRADKQFLEAFLARSYISLLHLGFPATVIGYSAGDCIQPADNFKVEPVQNSHLEKYRGRGLEYSPSYDSYSFYFSSGDGLAFVSGDVGELSDLTTLREIPEQLIILESSHIDPAAALQLAADKGFSKIVFTHIPDERAGLLHEIAGNGKIDSAGNIIIARDGLILHC